MFDYLIFNNNDDAYICDSNLSFGGGLHEGAASELSGHVEPLVLPHDPLVLEVALVADEDHGDLVTVLDSQYLLLEVLEIIECGLCRDAVDQDKALSVLHVEIPHGRELLSPGGVEDLQHALLAVHLHLLPVAVLDGGVVLLHEDPLDELDSEGRLAHSAGAQHHDLVLPHAELEDDWTDL